MTVVQTAASQDHPKIASGRTCVEEIKCSFVLSTLLLGQRRPMLFSMLFHALKGTLVLLLGPLLNLGENQCGGLERFDCEKI